MDLDHPMRINLDTGYRYPYGLMYVNRGLCKEQRKMSYRGNNFHLELTCTESTMTFSNFAPLDKLLRKPIPIDYSTSHYPRFRMFGGKSLLEDSSYISYRTQKLHVRLTFELEEPVAPEDLRISILPLVMETSSTRGSGESHISISHPQSDNQGIVTQRSHRIHLDNLRYSVTQALQDFVATHTKEQELMRPEV
jgi:hypothetical protein